MERIRISKYGIFYLSVYKNTAIMYYYICLSGIKSWGLIFLIIFLNGRDKLSLTLSCFSPYFFILFLINIVHKTINLNMSQLLYLFRVTLDDWK